jgi:hypothetical protein
MSSQIGWEPGYTNRTGGPFFIAITWNLWLARNRKVFDNMDPPIQRIKANCLETITLWAHRSRKAENRKPSVIGRQQDNVITLKTGKEWRNILKKGSIVKK